MNVFPCDVCEVPFVEDNIIVYLFTRFVLYDYYDSNKIFSTSQDN